MNTFKWNINNLTNGSHIKNIMILEKYDILIPFEVELKFFNDNSAKTVLEYYIETSPKYNIIIDNRMLTTITYLSFFIEDLLIYDTSINKVVTFYKYINKQLFNNKERMFDRLKLSTTLYLYNFVKTRCNNLYVNWKLENCLNSVTKFSYIKYSFNIEILIDYLQTSNDDISIIHNYKSKDIYNEFMLKDNYQKLNLKNKNELFMELLEIKKYKSKFILL